MDPDHTTDQSNEMDSVFKCLSDQSIEMDADQTTDQSNEMDPV